MSYFITTLQLPEYDYKFNNLYVSNISEYNEVYNSSTQFLIIEGFVFDLNLNKRLTGTEVIDLIIECNKTNSVFPDNVTGQYNITYISGEMIQIITDFVSTQPLYYHFGDDIFISNNIYKFIEFGFNLDTVGVLQSLIGILFTPLNSRSLVESVSLLRNGEYITYDFITHNITSIIDTMSMDNLKVSKKDVENIAAMLQTNGAMYVTSFNNIVLPISSGVDSRITVSSFKKFDSSFTALSYGEQDYIDNKIARKISNYIGISHKNISFDNHLFPTSEEFKSMISNGGEYLVSSWFSIISELKEGNYSKDSVVLLGDMLDTLRAKNIKSLRSRKERLKYQVKSAFGIALELDPLNLELYSEIHFKAYQSKMISLKNNYPQLFTAFKFDENDFLEKTKSDLDSFINFINKKFSPKNQANLEEAFYLCTCGTRTMGKQVNVFKGSFQSYALMSSRHLVKHNLKFSVLERFEDKLTHKLLKIKGFDMYSHFPTSQVPFVGYKSNIYLKYMIWALRSTIDQMLIKRGRGRLVKHIEWAKYYKNSKNKLLLELLLDEVSPDLKKIPIDIFNKRASGEAWPLSEVDINVFTFILKLQYLK